MATIYRKTAKAQQEIDTRVHRLAPRLRTALILVDGKRSDDELRAMIVLQADETLAALREQGFIEVAHGAVAPVRPATTVAPDTVPGGKPFEQWRREAVRGFTDVVGPMGEALALKMEKTRRPEELRPLLEMGRQVIANSRGAAAAAEFAERHLGTTTTA